VIESHKTAESAGMRRTIVATLILGALLNVFGWAGNVFLLGQMWDQAGQLAPPPLPSPFPPVVRDALTFVSDFVFAFVLASVFSLASPCWSRSQLLLAFACSGLVWLGGVPMTYLGIVNNGYLPPGVALATSVLALVGFVLFAPLLPRLLPVRRS
jgi:hypothetical protein